MNIIPSLRPFVVPGFAAIAAAAIAASVSSRVELTRARDERDAARTELSGLRVNDAVALARSEAKYRVDTGNAAVERDALRHKLDSVAADLADARASAASSKAELESVRAAADRDRAAFQKRAAAADLELSALRLTNESVLGAQRRQGEAANALVAAANAATRTAEARAYRAEADAASARSAPPVVVDNTVYTTNSTTVVRVEPDCPPQPVVVVRPSPRVVHIAPAVRPTERMRDIPTRPAPVAPATPSAPIPAPRPTAPSAPQSPSPGRTTPGRL